MSKQVLELAPKPTTHPRAYVWTYTWDPGTDSTPHYWIANKLLRSGVALYEVERGNASVVLGQKGRHEFPCDAEVVPGAGWLMESDCARPWPSVWPPMHCAFRRYALYPANRPDLKDDAQRAAQGTFQYPEKRAAFGPLNIALPKLTPIQEAQAAATSGGRLGAVRAALLHGSTAYISQEDGPQLAPWNGWRVHGPPRGDEVGGSGVFADSGWQGNDETTRLYLLEAEMAHERAWHAYDRATGQPITADNYPDPGPKYAPGSEDVNNGWLPEFVGVAANPDPLPQAYDAAHSIRGFRFAVALRDMLDSPMALRAVSSYAAQARLAFSERGALPSGGYFPPTLRNALNAARAAPNTGGGGIAGRIAGWPAFLLAAHLKYNGGSEGDRDWAAMFLEWARTCTPGHGIAQRVRHSPGSDIWYDPNFDLAHAFEAPIWYFGVAALARQTLARMPDEMRRAGVSLYETVRKGPYYSGDVGPMDYLFVAHRDGLPVEQLTDGKGGDEAHGLFGDATHAEALCGLLASEYGARFLQDSCTIAHQVSSVEAKRLWLGSQSDLYTRAFLLAQLEKVTA